MIPRIAFIVAMAVSVNGCGSDSDLVLEGMPSTPLCVAGCVGPGPDPNPQASGAWVGYDFTDDLCFGGYPDSDQDGLGDLCELRLIEAFAPNFITTDDGGNDLDGEWYWAAEPFEGAPSAVQLAYLPAYYRDEGAAAPPVIHQDDHEGDSEAILLRIEYRPSTLHWVLRAGVYSAHSIYNIYGSGAGSHPMQLSYPANPGSFPSVWVSKWKHANYNSHASCNAGGAYNTDVCTTLPNTVQWRFPVYEHHNLGSNSVQLKNCVTAEFNPSRSGTECFWHNVPKPYYSFRGWNAGVPHTGGANSNGLRLADFGFIP